GSKWRARRAGCTCTGNGRALSVNLFSEENDETVSISISAKYIGRLQLVMLFVGWLFGILLPAVVWAKDTVETKQQRGAYLTRVANCAGCHTARGGQDFAGGRILNTPFGEFVVSNITPDAETGLGRWSEEDFWQALHHGKSKDG